VEESRPLVRGELQDGPRGVLAVADGDGAVGGAGDFDAVFAGCAVTRLAPRRVLRGHAESPIFFLRSSAASVSRLIVAAPERLTCRRCSYPWVYLMTSL